MKTFNLIWHKSINEIKKKDWDLLTQNNVNPFYNWNWLHALEKSESISLAYGWQPNHLTVWENNKLIGFAPLYLKGHSYGEFIFDQGFAKLANQLNLAYYPKLIGMSPLSPIEGYRFFIEKNKNESELTNFMLNSIDTFAIQNNILSCNFLYVDKNWKKYCEEANYTSWINKKSLWRSNGENSFDEFLRRFNSNQRRNIKRELKSIENEGIQISILNSNDIDLEIMRIMHSLYQSHCSKWGVWGSKYLTTDFFDYLIDENIRNNIVIFNANRGNIKDPIAMSLCVTDWEILWGRYWGSNEDIKNLHFNLCYYKPISWAIEKGIKKFDPGAGGQHKSRRGFPANQCFSLHRWYNKTMETILKEYLPKINKLTIEEIYTSNNEVPFKEIKREL